jgi:gliding motility-associated-like protein
MRSYFSFFFFLFSLTSIFSEAQDFCNPEEWVKAGLGKPTTGGFKVVGSKFGCAPFQVDVEKTVGDNHKYIFSYKNGNPFTGYMLFNEPTTVYIEAGAYKILQLGSNGTASVYCDDVEVFSKPNITKKECSGRRVVITVVNDSLAKRYDSFLIDWGDGTLVEGLPKSANMSLSRVYPNSNPRIVSVTGVYKGVAVRCLTPASVSVLPSNVDASAVSVRRVTVRNDGLIDVFVNGANGVMAELQGAQSGGNFGGLSQTISKNDTTTFTVRNIDLKQGPFCFRMSANDGCENVGSASNVVCTVSLDATAANKQNDLKWTEYPNVDFQNYQIVRNTMQLGGTINSKSFTNYSDKAIVCGENYAYQVVVSLPNNAKSVSQLRTVKAISDEIPSIVRTPFVDVLEKSQQIEVRAVAPLQGATPFKFKGILLRADDNGDFKEIETKDNSLTFSDINAKTSEKSYCYKLQYENACGNRSALTDAFCSVYLYSKSSTSIDWTSDWPYTVSVGHYVLEKYDESGNVVAQDDKGGNTTFSPNLDDPDPQLFRYRIQTFSTGSEPQSHSNFFVFRKNAQIYLPDAFTPNGDGINDTFSVKGRFIDTFRIAIMNRWGNVVYDSTDPKSSWDGTFDSRPLPEDTYVYRVEIIDSLGERFTKRGTVLLLR